MKVSDYIVEFLSLKGITDVFGYPGGMVTHLMDSFGKQNKIQAHVNYHEQASAFCACGYAQASCLPGVAYATSGPGATNLITGIANAYFDSIPCLFITGQVNTYESKENLPVRQKGFQEADIVGMTKPITKYAVQITDEKNIRYELEKAFYLSMNGRPGPVLLDIPMNIQRQDISPQDLLSYVPEDNKFCQMHDLAFVIEALKKSNRPCIIVGAGVKTSGMVQKFRKLVSKLSVPVVSSMLAFDVLPIGDDNFYGFIGAYGNRAANFILTKSDLIISFGSRLDGRQTGSKELFAPNARLIRIDIDADELSNRIKPDEQQINLDLRIAISSLINYSDSMEELHFDDWNGVCKEIAKRLDDTDCGEPIRMLKQLSRHIPDNTVITTDVGQNQVWTAQSFEVKENQQVFFSGGHGAMGYSLPAAIGAYYASGKKAVSINGDGGVQMNMQELQFLARERIPVKVVILNNNSLGMIRHFQEMYFDSFYMQTTEDNGYTAPSFQKIASAYGLSYHRIENLEDCAAAIFEDDVPAVIEVVLPKTTYVYPKLAINKPIQDQDPPINRELFEYLMKL